MNNSELLESLDSVTTIPPVVFREGKIDYEAHQKNMSYLLNRNFLTDGRKRVISLAGTSLIHHIGHADQLRLAEETGNLMKNDGVFMSAIVPNPIGEGGALIEKQAALPRPPKTPELEATLTILPPLPCSIILLAAIWPHLKTPPRFTSNTLSQKSSCISRNGALSIIPALQINTSIYPIWLEASANIFSIDDLDETSTYRE